MGLSACKLSGDMITTARVRSNDVEAHSLPTRLMPEARRAAPRTLLRAAMSEQRAAASPSERMPARGTPCKIYRRSSRERALHGERPGEVTERPKVRHWKYRVGVKPHRGFESRPLRLPACRCATSAWYTGFCLSEHPSELPVCGVRCGVLWRGGGLWGGGCRRTRRSSS